MATFQTNLTPTLTAIPTTGYYLQGTEGNDSVYGSGAADTMHGFGGNDSMFAGAGDDQVFGDGGNDTLNGENGNDTLDGGVGDDVLIGGAGADTLIGGFGMDTASYISAAIGVSVDLATGGITNDAQGDTYSGIENLTGSNYGDILNGNAFGNVIDGLAGDDWLFGQGGDDTIMGGAGIDHLGGGTGDDFLRGGLGSDILTGNDGFDRFVFAKAEGSDTITDFERGTDKIVLSGFGATPFGRDGVLAYGYYKYPDVYEYGPVDGADKVFLDMETGKLYEIAPTIINGHVDLNPVSQIGVINCVGSFSHFASASDFTVM